VKATELLHNLGQSLWLDNITRDLLNTGTLKSYIDELSVTGLTSNPTIFDRTDGVDGWVSLEVSPVAGVRHSQDSGCNQRAGCTSWTREPCSSRFPARRKGFQSWNDLMTVITSKSAVLKKAAGQ